MPVNLWPEKVPEAVLAVSPPMKGGAVAGSFESAADGIEYVPRLAGTTHVTVIAR